jgi:hypothetical protein
VRTGTSYSALSNFDPGTGGLYSSGTQFADGGFEQRANAAPLWTNQGWRKSVRLPIANLVWWEKGGATHSIGIGKTADAIFRIFGATVDDSSTTSGNQFTFDVATAVAAINGNTIWHVGNDGVGSGLDADYLHGQTASYYTNIPARLGYTPANRAGDSFTGTITAPQVTSDLLYQSRGAGQQVYQSLARSGVARWNMGLQSDDKFAFFAYDNSGVYLNTPLEIGRNGGLITAARTVWDSGNDGAGSGLDADFIRGQSPSAFAPIANPAFTGTPNVSGNNIFHAGNFTPTQNPLIVLRTKYNNGGSPINIAAGGTSTATFTATGVLTTDFISATLDNNSGVIISAKIPSNDQVEIVFRNPTAASINALYSVSVIVFR